MQRCDFVVAICSVGGLKPSHGVGTLLVCSDFWCPWDLRRVYEDARAHVMPSLCEPLRRVMLDIVRGAGEHPLPTGVYANARGPRFETRTEIRLMADYCDVVGMTAAHEASACCEVGLPYAMLAMVDNFANGVGNETLTVDAFHAAQASNLVRLERCVEALLAALPLRAAEVAPPGGGGGGAGTGAGNGAGAAPHGAPEPVDLLVHARWVVCMAPGREGEVLEAHAVASRGGRIVAVLPSAAATARFLPTRVVTLDARHALMPGLVNAHTHLAMNLMRGLSDDKPLMAWLSEAIWPVEGKLVDAEFVRAGARAAVGELIKGGVTTFNDMYFFPEATASVAEAAGVRALVGLPILEFPTGYASGAEDYVAKGLATAKAWGERAAAGAASSRVTFALAPHAPYTVADATLARLAALSAAALPPLRVHIHLHETEGEVLASKTGGKQGTSKHLSDEQTSPLVNLDRLGLLNERLIAVHMTCLTDEEMARVAASGASVVHCAC
jgi:cytosine/adenosine deaminase-related metal-dependent hydrolase